jgi:hypothetical protein
MVSIQTKNTLRKKNISSSSATVKNNKSTVVKNDRLSDIEQAIMSSILRTLIYFDIFSYPLTKQEIFSYCDYKINNLSSAEKALNWLCSKSFLNSDNGFYYLDDDKSKIERRIEGNKLAAQKMKTARFYSKIIAAFPFVRAVCISGSLSKNYMDQSSDIDYFIVTKPGRLWLSRFMLVLFKKVFLLNSYKNFCINYVVDTDNLEIKERSIYSATETMLLLPMINNALFNEFMNVNKWCRNFYPNFIHEHQIPGPRSQFLKTFLEWLLSNRLGDLLEKKSYKYTIGYWKRKFGKKDPFLFERSVECSEGVSRYHPLQQQTRIMNLYQENILNFELKTGLLLRNEKV